MPKLYKSIQLTWRNGIRYLPLLQNLVQRELKKKYRSSVLGYLWCILNPLLVMLIMTVVFSRMFRNSIENFPVYVFTGRMFFSFVTGGAANTLRSITGNGSLMRKTRIPYYIFPLSSFISSLVDFLFSLAAFALVLIITQTAISIHVIFFPVIILEAMLITFGLGMLLAVANVFVRDINYLWGVFCTAWMYLSAIFYPLTSLPKSMQQLIARFNPLYYLIGQTRSIFLEHSWPCGESVLAGFLVGIVFCILGAAAYQKSKNNMILYV